MKDGGVVGQRRRWHICLLPQENFVDDDDQIDAYERDYSREKRTSMLARILVLGGGDACVGENGKTHLDTKCGYWK